MQHLPLNGEKGGKGSVWADYSRSEFLEIEKRGVSKAHLNEFERSELPLYREADGWVTLLLFDIKLGERLEKERVHAYLKDGSIFTVNCAVYFEQFKKDASGKQTAEDALSFVILELTERNELALEEIERQIDEAEEKLLRKNTMPVEKFLAIKRTILSMNKIFWHERDMLFFIRHSPDLSIGEAARSNLDEAHASLLYSIDMNGTFREILTDALDVYHTMMSNRINASIKQLTVVTVILAIVSAVTGIPNTIATIFGIPYFPISASQKIMVLFGADIYPWDIILMLLVLGSVVPTFVLYWWWNKVKGKD
jgi:Mg2+ and Co2+ transporter CorA